MMFEDIIKSLRICADDRSCSGCIMKDQRQNPCGCFNMLMTKAADELETAANVIAGYSGRLEDLRKQVPHWISVKDRLPDNSETVICFSAVGVFAGWYGDISEQWYFDRGNGNVCSWPVTHWMPLPEPPEVEHG